MKKVVFTLAVLVMAFGNVSFAQRNAYLKSTEKEIVLRHYGLRNDDIRPSVATWSSVADESYRTTYTYDEYDYYLIEELIEMDLGDGWIPAYMITYEYGFSGDPLETIVYANADGEWIEEEHALYTYGTNEMEIVFQMMIDGQWVNSSKEVYNYNGDVTTVLIWAWNGSTWTSSLLNTYTYSDTSIEVLMQYMQGGAWQNEGKATYTLDFEGNVTDILSLAWVNNAWENNEHTIYHYSDGVFMTKTFDKWYDGAWNEEFQYSFIYDDGNATHGTCMVMDDNNWIPGDGDIEMAYNYNAASNEYNGVEVDVTYIDLTALKENASTASFKVYPVPAENEIQIQAEGFQKAEIYSLTGQKLMESLCDRMNVSVLTSGLYVMKVYDREGGCSTQRFVVK